MNFSPTERTRRAAAAVGALCALLVCAAACRADATSAVTANNAPPAAGPAASSAAAEPRPTPTSEESKEPAAAAQDNPEKRLIGGRSTGGEEPTLRDVDSGGGLGNLFRWLWPLLAVVAVILLVFWLARKYLPGMKRLGGSEAVKVLGRTYLSPRQSILVVRVGRRLIVVGQSPEHLAALDSVTDPAEISELLGLCESGQTGSAASSFRRVFQQEERKFAAVEDQAVEAEELRRIRDELDTLAQKVRRVAGPRS